MKANRALYMRLKNGGEKKIIYFVTEVYQYCGPVINELPTTDFNKVLEIKPRHQATITKQFPSGKQFVTHDFNHSKKEWITRTP